MALRDLLLRMLGSSEVRQDFQDNTPVGMPVSSGIQSYVVNWAETGRFITPEIARSSPSVHACTMLISQSIARMEWKVFLERDDGHLQPTPTHPLYRLLNTEPNPFMGALTWRQSMLLDCLLYGNGYSYIERDPTGRPIRLEKLRPDLMQAMRASDNSVIYSYAAGTTGARTFPAYDIFHLIGPSADGLLGEPPIYLARQLIGIEIEAESFVASFFQNGARPAGVLEVQGTLSPDAWQRLRQSWQDMQGGARNAGRIAVLEAGYQFKPITINPDDAQLIELRRYCREQIAAAFGVPPHMVGDSTKQSYASAEQADLEFTKHTLGTWASRLEEECTRKLLRDGDRMRTSISFDALTRGDLGGRFSAYATALQHGFLTINEVRAREGLAPVDGGESLRVPLQLGPLPTAKNKTPTQAEQQAAGVGQLQAMTALAQAAASGAVPADAAKGIIAAAFPAMPSDAVAGIVEPLAQAAEEAAKAPPPAEPPPAAPAPPDASGGDSAPPPTAPPATDGATVEGRSARDCGTGSGGFQPGNECGKGEGGVGADASGAGEDGSSAIPDASELKTVGRLGGSTGAVLTEDADGNQYVVKGGNSADHIRSEAAANDIYAAAGVPIPAHRLDETNPDAPKQITKFVEGKPIGDLKGEAFAAAAAKLSENFATDALLANWDVVGMSGDNVLVAKDGTPMRVDNGGSLAFRAQGGPKTFGDKVGELESMRTSDQGRRVFGKLTNPQIASQIRDLGRRRASILRATPKSLRGTISARLDYMERWAKENGARSADDAITFAVVDDRTMRDCVEDKIKILVDEGYEQDQAIAIALDYCGDEDRDCGTGAGGFQPGNECGKGEGSGGEGGGSAKQPGEWVNKKGSEYAAAVKTAGDAKLHACLVAQHQADGLSKKEAMTAATQELLTSSAESKAIAAKEFGINMSAEENQVEAKSLKNDPGIYAKEKAIAAGYITAAQSGSQANVAPIKADPTAPPTQPKVVPVAPTAPKDPSKEPAIQPPKDQAQSSSTPGVPPPGILPTGHAQGWVDQEKPKPTDAQLKVMAKVPLAKEAVEAYSGSSYEGLNAKLRQGEYPYGGFGVVEGMSPKQAAMVGALDVLTRIDQRDPPPATVYRGAGATVARELDKLGVGNTWTELGYLSTSTAVNTASGFGSKHGGVMMRIRTRQGVSIQDLSGLPGEREVLLPRGARFRVTSKEWRYSKGVGPRLYIDLEHIDTN